MFVIRFSLLKATAKSNRAANNHLKSKRDKNESDRKEKRPKLDKDGKFDKIQKLKNPTSQSSGTKRKLEEGELDPEPNENKRHERYY